MSSLALPFLFSLAVLVCLIDLAPAPVANRRQVPAPQFRLNSTVTQKLMAKCKKVDGECKRQPKEAAKRRQSLKTSMIKKGKRKNSEVEEAFKRTYAAKKALYKLQGLENVEPADNGLWGHDLILNVEQAKYLENFYKSGGKPKAMGPPPPPAPSTSKKNGKKINKRSNAMRFDVFPVKKWDMNPIPVLIDPTYFSSDQAAEVRRALDTISSSTCIKFNELKEAPSSGDYVFILPFDASTASFCGAAQIGKQSGPSFVYIGAGGSCSNTYGMALHEIMHALGFQHEHQRYDRDQYIKVFYTEGEWGAWYLENLATFPLDVTTYYGTKYDYMSVMHYPLYLKWFELVPGMGGEQYASEIGLLKGLSKSDVDALNRAYCPDPTCKDSDEWGKYCEFWNTAYEFCQRKDGAVELYCQKTCGVCTNS